MSFSYTRFEKLSVEKISSGESKILSNHITLWHSSRQRCDISARKAFLSCQIGELDEASSWREAIFFPGWKAAAAAAAQGNACRWTWPIKADCQILQSISKTRVKKIKPWCEAQIGRNVGGVCMGGKKSAKGVDGAATHGWKWWQRRGYQCYYFWGSFWRRSWVGRG